MTTTTRPRQLDRNNFVRRCRELIDEGLPREQVIERMNPCRGSGLTEAFTTDVVAAISSALAIADSVSNAKMTQAHRDFVNRERYATEFDGVAASTRAHIDRMYPDAPIRAEKLRILLAEQQRRRAVADQAAEDWTAIQKRRIPFDKARADYPEAFIDFTDWQPKGT